MKKARYPSTARLIILLGLSLLISLLAIVFFRDNVYIVLNIVISLIILLLGFFLLVAYIMVERKERTRPRISHDTMDTNWYIFGSIGVILAAVFHGIDAIFTASRDWDPASQNWSHPGNYIIYFVTMAFIFTGFALVCQWQVRSIRKALTS